MLFCTQSVILALNINFHYKGDFSAVSEKSRTGIHLFLQKILYNVKGIG